MTIRSISTNTVAWWRKRQPKSDIESKAKLLRDRQCVVEIQLLAVPTASWLEAAAKARYVLNLYAAGLAPDDTHHRNLVAAIMADLPDSPVNLNRQIPLSR
jgi:hypothetical protein